MAGSRHVPGMHSLQLFGEEQATPQRPPALDRGMPGSDIASYLLPLIVIKFECKHCGGTGKCPEMCPKSRARKRCGSSVWTG